MLVHHSARNIPGVIEHERAVHWIGGKPTCSALTASQNIGGRGRYSMRAKPVEFKLKQSLSIRPDLVLDPKWIPRILDTHRADVPNQGVDRGPLDRVTVYIEDTSAYDARTLCFFNDGLLSSARITVRRSENRDAFPESSVSFLLFGIENMVSQGGVDGIPGSKSLPNA